MQHTGLRAGTRGMRRLGGARRAFSAQRASTTDARRGQNDANSVAQSSPRIRRS
jgi:hypothetical protein